MKKIIIVLAFSLLVFSGCGSDMKLKKSGELINSSSVYVSYSDSLDSEDILSEYNDQVNNIARAKCLIDYVSYSSIMSEKVSSINASGGATGDVYTIGNETIELLDDFYDYLYSDEFNVEDAYGQLIIIRDNMKKIGFLD